LSTSNYLFILCNAKISIESAKKKAYHIISSHNYNSYFPIIDSNSKLAASFGTTQQSIVTKYIMAAKVMIGQISMEQLSQSCDQAK
jgi:hypothetical protein